MTGAHSDIRRLLVAPLLVVPLLAGGGAAQAQSANEKRAAVDHMLDALKAAPDPRTASLLEDKVIQAWLQAGTPAVTLLMSRGLRSLHAGQDDDAVESFTDAIILAPDVAEAWHQRAIARYHGGDTAGAIHDLEETVKREPRDFAAFHTLADIAAAREDWKAAYAAWQKVMELDPQTPGGEERLGVLKRKAVGEDT
ncbi:tetratricopeptide repeat protein [Rhodopila sp.]|uniref:tetratricopeptide repeat protein n=1 Tax=Rhodopila sp. TaxID=2480087 RepID=UPI003D10C86A